MNSRIRCERLDVDAGLHRFIENEALPGTGVKPAAFWKGLSELAHDFAPRVRELLATRDRIQAEMDRWHREHPGPIRDAAAYRAHLEAIGYL
ncbi:MAG: malate synthase G, partial [Azoarcus sp.]|nr:malate synthase G [Azoarcus sp.]